MIKINIKSKRYNCELNINQKVTIIRGDSGKGKTTLYRAVDEENDAFRIALSDTNYDLICLHHKGWYDLIDYRISNKIRSIYIIDDDDFVLTKEFSHLLSLDKYSFYVIINRFESISINQLGRIPFSIKEVYNFKTNGVDHWLEPYYSYESNEIKTIDYVITEDSGSGLTFLRYIFDNIESARGKDNILRYIDTNKERFSGKNLFLFIDVSGYGSCFELLKEYMSINNMNVFFLSSYESFEYMLLSSNMFNFDFSKLSNKDIASETSLEILCEVILDKITKGKPYSYTKESSLNKCYTRDCCVHRRDKNFVICDKQLRGSKIVELLKNTKFEVLLDLASKLNN